MDKIKVITMKDNESYLRQKSLPVDLTDNKLESDILVLEQFCKENDVLAMAAIQLGIPKRLIYLKNTKLEIIEKMQTDSETEEEKNYNEARVLINPVIVLKEGYQYRPDGWTSETGNTDARPGETQEQIVHVDEAWWGNYILRGFNVSRVGKPPLSEADYAEFREAFIIYVPKK